ncbi:MAG: sugar transferase [Propionibacteriaceae bacterium]|nr:sugar transferase [Propionibacteriaceae bacterium]
MIRARDILLSGLALGLAAPLFLLIALAVRFDSAGPVFFRQERVGRYGRRFRIHKFRTMRTGASGPAVSTAADPRVTRVGRVLRLSKADELPQLIDVLRGDMSLVGPRPEVPHYVDLWPDELRPVILSVRPGITDPATVLLRNEAEILQRASDPEQTYVETLLPMKARAYAEYVRNRSFFGDLRVLVGTIVAIARPAAGREVVL